MSYLDRLKRKISENAPKAEATKVSKGAFVPFVATPAAPFQQIAAAGVDPEALRGTGNAAGQCKPKGIETRL